MQMEKTPSYCIFIDAEIEIKASQCDHYLQKKSIYPPDKHIKSAQTLVWHKCMTAFREN